MPLLSLSLLTRALSLARSSGYYQPTKHKQDNILADQIRSVLTTHKSYGYRRIAITLGLGKKRVRRVMKLYGIKPYKRKARWRKRRDERRKPAPYLNQIKNQCPLTPNHAWVSDFTYLRFKQRFVYLATLLDLYTREILGFSVSLRHDKHLITNAFLDAYQTTNFIKPSIVHSDQGAEYCSKEYTSLMTNMGIQISMSKKSSPGEVPLF